MSAINFFARGELVAGRNADGLPEQATRLMAMARSGLAELPAFELALATYFDGCCSAMERNDPTAFDALIRDALMGGQRIGRHGSRRRRPHRSRSQTPMSAFGTR